MLGGEDVNGARETFAPSNACVRLFAVAVSLREFSAWEVDDAQC